MEAGGSEQPRLADGRSVFDPKKAKNVVVWGRLCVLQVFFPQNKTQVSGVTRVSGGHGQKEVGLEGLEYGEGLVGGLFSMVARPLSGAF